MELKTSARAQIIRVNALLSVSGMTITSVSSAADAALRRTPFYQWLPVTLGGEVGVVKRIG